VNDFSKHNASFDSASGSKRNKKYNREIGCISEKMGLAGKIGPRENDSQFASPDLLFG
jgi:hypothetical protein